MKKILRKIVPVFIFALIAVSCEKKEITVPGSEFKMGCVKGDDQCFSMEKPQHKVYISAFKMDKHEVTVNEYEKCVEAGVCREPKKGKWFNYGLSGHVDHPVNGVSWEDARAYCNWKNKRLPTEAEWEKAARGKSEGTIYSWGSEKAACDKAVMNEKERGCGKDSTWEVCSKPKNSLGLCDMEGNVSEWCSDKYEPIYYKKSPENDPEGPEKGEFRVFRGGSWRNEAIQLRTSIRGWSFPERRIDSVGFRCVSSK